MSGLLNPNLNGSASNLPDSTVRPFTASFSGQSGSIPGFHHSGLHNIHGNYGITNMSGSLAQRNAAISGLPSSGVQQPGGSMPGRFAANNLPVALSQIPHAHSGVSGRGMNVGAGPAFSSSMNIGGTIQGLSSNLGSGGNRNSVPGILMSPALGTLDPRITGSVGNIVDGNNVGRNISSGGLLVPGSWINLSGNAGSDNLGVQGSNRMMNGLLQQGSLRRQGVGVNAIVQHNQEFSIQNEDFPALPGFKGNSSDYAMELYHKEQFHENLLAMQAQQYPHMARSDGFNLGSNYLPNRQQHQQGAISFQNAGIRPPSQTSSSGSYDQLLQQYQQPQTQNSSWLQQISSSANPYRDQSPKSVQGGPTPPDPYGLTGLLGVVTINDHELKSLALGLDLTSLGLDLDSPDNLYKTFDSPWPNEPAIGDPDFHIPACYFAGGSPPLKPALFQKSQTLTLFYIFYSMPKDEAQLYAASELLVHLCSEYQYAAISLEMLKNLL